MSTTRTALGPALALIAAGLAPPASAHHSLAKFDGSRTIKIEGTVTEFRWFNPHASVKIDGIADGDLPDGAWAVEMSPPNVLMGQGWKRDSLVTGDKVTIFVNPPRDTTPGADGHVRGLYVGIILADGGTLGIVEDEDQS